jgi:hypothetical protein
MQTRLCRRVWLGLVVLASVTAVSPFVEASGDIRVRYRAPSVCPDQRVFEGELNERLGDAPRPSTVLDVDLAVAAGEGSEHVVGHLLRDGRPLRTIEGATCGEVVKALALVAALGILPPERGGDASLAPPPSPAGSGAGPVPTSAVAAPPTRPSTGSIVVGAGGLVDSFTAAGVTPGGAIFVDVGLPSAAPALAPHLRVSFGLTPARESTTRSAAGASIVSSFSRLFGSAALCPLGVALDTAQRFVVRPCAGVEIDQIRGKSTGISAPREASPVFAAGQLFPRLEWHSAHVVVGTQAGLVLPFAPPRFIVENPETTVYQVPKAGFLGQIDVGLRVF